MEKKSIYSILLVILMVFGCVKERETEYSFLFGSIDGIELNVEEKVFIVNNKKQILDLDVKFLDSSGKELALGDNLKTEIWINDSLSSIAEIDLSTEKVYKVKLALPTSDIILSNTIDIHVVALENAVDNIQLFLKNSATVFIKFEDTLDFTSYINVNISDTLGNVHMLDTVQHDFDFFVDGQKINSREIVDFPNGRLTVSIGMGGKTSNLLDIEVLDPTSGISELIWIWRTIPEIFMHWQEKRVTILNILYGILITKR